MDKKEKVMKGLACCKEGVTIGEEFPYEPKISCENCPYEPMHADPQAKNCLEQLCADALELLKEQEPKVLALEELSTDLENQFLWVEACDGRMYHMEVLAVHLSTSGVTDIDFNLPTCFLELSTNNMGKKWRPWTSCPTDEQREAVSWQ